MAWQTGWDKESNADSRSLATPTNWHQRELKRMTREWCELIRDYRCLFAQGGYAIRRGRNPARHTNPQGYANLSASPVLCNDCYSLKIHDELILTICRCRTAGRLSLASTKACESDRQESVMLPVPFTSIKLDLEKPLAKTVLVGGRRESLERGDATNQCTGHLQIST
jgi:hypothetical protein